MISTRTQESEPQIDLPHCLLRAAKRERMNLKNKTSKPKTSPNYNSKSIALTDYHTRQLEEGVFESCPRQFDLPQNSASHGQVSNGISRVKEAFCVVIKGLHFSKTADFITEELKVLGDTILNLKNTVSRTTKSSLAMFFVHLEPAANNKKVFKVTRLYHVVVTVEEPRKFNDLDQCQQCLGCGQVLQTPAHLCQVRSRALC